MQFFGIPLRRPSYAEFTSSTILGVGLWIAVVGLLVASGQAVTRTDAACALIVTIWSCLAARLGIHVGRGPRHLLLNVVVSGVLLVACQAGAWALGA